jgi:hypothetical protein
MENKYDPLAVWTQFAVFRKKKYVEDIGSILEETKEHQKCLSDFQGLIHLLNIEVEVDYFLGVTNSRSAES